MIATCVEEAISNITKLIITELAYAQITYPRAREENDGLCIHSSLHVGEK